MKNLIVALLVLSLSACTICPPKIEYVPIPEELLFDQGNLNELKADANLKDVAATIDQNYLKYHITREQVKQIKIFQEKVINGTSKKNTD